jgi:hypothetical protein
MPLAAARDLAQESQAVAAFRTELVFSAVRGINISNELHFLESDPRVRGQTEVGGIPRAEVNHAEVAQHHLDPIEHSHELVRMASLAQDPSGPEPVPAGIDPNPNPARPTRRVRVDAPVGNEVVCERGQQATALANSLPSLEAKFRYDHAPVSAR